MVNKMNATQLIKAPGSPNKKLHYHVDGTGRDTYIHANHGGLMSNYRYTNDRQAYVKSLRTYDSSLQSTQYNIGKRSMKQNKGGKGKDYFIEGQISIRSPKIRNGIQILQNYQKF
jgi:hypothetical protein